MNRRTKFDFSRHEVKVTKLEGVLIHEFKRPDSYNGSLIFINTCGIMSISWLRLITEKLKLKN